MQNVKYGLNKLTITDKQQELIRELVSKNKSGAFIAKKLRMSQSKIWRQMEMMGLNKKKKCKKKKYKKKKVFSWNDYKHNSLI